MDTYQRLTREREIQRRARDRSLFLNDLDLACPSCESPAGKWCLHFDGRHSLPNHGSRLQAVRELNLATRAAIESELDAEGWTP